MLNGPGCGLRKRCRSSEESLEAELPHWRSVRQREKRGQFCRASRARFQRTLGEKTSDEADFAKRGGCAIAIGEGRFTRDRSEATLSVCRGGEDRQLLAIPART
jgi:hypothetical protein